MTNITAIIVTYNSAGVVGEALASLKAQPQIARIIVVDNASQDKCCAFVSTHFPDVLLVRNEKNLGFGMGNNMALPQVETEFALLVNPDAVLQPGAVEALLAAAARYSEAGILAPRLFYEDGSGQPSHKTSLFQREQCRAPYIEPEGDLCAEFLSGALWLVRIDALHKTGYFDPEIFFYYEDDDLCLRMRKAGYSLVLVNDAHAVHGMGKSSAPSPDSRRFRLYHDIWSRLYIEYKYRGREAAQRMIVHKYWRYRLWRLTSIPSLVGRYGPRLQAVKDFMAYLESMHSAIRGDKR